MLILWEHQILLKARLNPSVKSILIVTSDKVYENNEKNSRFRESDRLGGDDPYSASKACAEITLKVILVQYLIQKTQILLQLEQEMLLVEVMFL